MTDHDGNGSTTSAGPRIDPAQPVDPKSGELRAEKNSLRRFIKVLGPGLVTGASDDDPSWPWSSRTPSTPARGSR